MLELVRLHLLLHWEAGSFLWKLGTDPMKARNGNHNHLSSSWSHLWAAFSLSFSSFLTSLIIPSPWQLSSLDVSPVQGATNGQQKPTMNHAIEVCAPIDHDPAIAQS